MSNFRDHLADAEVTTCTAKTFLLSRPDANKDEANQHKVMHLLAVGANKDEANTDGFTPLHIAYESHAEIIDRPLAARANKGRLTKMVGHHCTSLPSSLLEPCRNHQDSPRSRGQQRSG